MASRSPAEKLSDSEKDEDYEEICDMRGAKGAPFREGLEGILGLLGHAVEGGNVAAGTSIRESKHEKKLGRKGYLE